MKTLLLVFYFILFSGVSFAQSIKFSLCAEPKMIWMKSDNKEKISSNHPRFGFNGGLLMNSYFTPRYAFSSGICLNTINGEMSVSAPVNIELENRAIESLEKGNIKYKLQYINLPVGLKLKTDPIGMVTICSKVGVIPQINVKSSAVIESAEYNIYQNEIHLFNALYQIGGGIEYSIGGGSAVSLLVLYRNSFLDISKEQKNELQDKITFSNVGLQIGLIF